MSESSIRQATRRGTSKVPPPSLCLSRQSAYTCTAFRHGIEMYSTPLPTRLPFYSPDDTSLVRVDRRRLYHHKVDSRQTDQRMNMHSIKNTTQAQIPRNKVTASHHQSSHCSASSNWRPSQRDGRDPPSRACKDGHVMLVQRQSSHYPVRKMRSVLNRSSWQPNGRVLRVP